MTRPPASLTDRYTRAARLSAPRLAATVPCSPPAGYWIDDTHFFFLDEPLEPAGTMTQRIPSQVNAISGEVTRLLPSETLTALLSQATDTVITSATLATAEYDYSAPNTLAVTIVGWECAIGLDPPRILKAERTPATPALYSPDGRYACFLKDGELWVRDRASAEVRALSTDSAPYYRMAQLSDSEISGIAYRENPAPVGLWSPDSRWFLTQRVDERAAPDAALIQHAPPDRGPPRCHRMKSIAPADPIPTAAFHAFEIASGVHTTFPTAAAPATGYSTFAFQLAWFGGQDRAWLIRRDRYSTRLELLELGLADGSARVVITETAPSGYLDVRPIVIGTPNVRTLERTREVIWYSERDGTGHLYLYDADTGALKNRITQGTYSVRDIVQVDEEGRRVFLLIGGLDAEADSAQRIFCSIGLDGRDFKILTRHGGDVFVGPTAPVGLSQDRPLRPASAHPGMSPDGRFAVVSLRSVLTGNRTEILDLHSQKRHSLKSVKPTPGSVIPRPFSALGADNRTRLHGVLFLPPDFNERSRYPLIAYIYPGPQIAHQPQLFGAVNAAPALALAELGFVTLMLDTRGMPIRDRAFHQVGFPEWVEPQLADHAAVIRELCKRHPFLDLERIGMLGHSAGGTATARAMFDYSDLYQVGVSVCGLHDADLALSPWSDKYRGPALGRDRRGDSNLVRATKLRGKLLLISGDLDENVPLSQTLSLAHALAQANRDFDLLIVPNEGHLLMLTSAYVQRRIYDYFVQHLLGETPPPARALDLPTEEELVRFAQRYASEFY